MNKIERLLGRDRFLTTQQLLINELSVSSSEWEALFYRTGVNNVSCSLVTRHNQEQRVEEDGENRAEG